MQGAGCPPALPGMRRGNFRAYKLYSKARDEAVRNQQQEYENRMQENAEEEEEEDESEEEVEDVAPQPKQRGQKRASLSAETSLTDTGEERRIRRKTSAPSEQPFTETGTSSPQRPPNTPGPAAEDVAEATLELHVVAHEEEEIRILTDQLTSLRAAEPLYPLVTGVHQWISYRPTIVKWLLEDGARLRLSQVTIQTAIRLTDILLERLSLKECRVHLLTLAAILVAGKYHEQDRRCPGVQQLVNLSKRSYTRQDIIDMESVVLNTLDFRLGVVIPLQYLQYYEHHGVVFKMDHATCPNSGAQTIPTADTVVTVYGWMCHLNTMLLSDTKFQTFRPSVAAAAIVAAARHYSHVLPIWSDTLVQLTQVTTQELWGCFEHITALYDRQAAKVAPSNGGSTVTPQTKRSRSVVALQYTTPSPQAPTRTAHKVHTADSWHM